MDYKQIEAFVNVVKFKSFSKAADATFLTQPTISTHVATLEKELDTTLLERGNKEVTLTAEGHLFYEHAMDMINSREKAYIALKSVKDNLHGVLDIYSSSIPGQYLLPKLLSEFRQQNPGIKIYLEQSDSDEVIEKIRLRQGEIGFTGKKANGDLAYTLIKKDKVVLITPKTDKFTSIKSDVIKLEEFVHEPFIWREQGSATRSEFEEAIRNKGIIVEDMNNVAIMNSLESIENAVSAGMGVSIVSKLAVPEYKNVDFLTFEIEDFSFEREFYMVHNPNKNHSPIVDVFIDFVGKKIEGGI